MDTASIKKSPDEFGALTEYVKLSRLLYILHGQTFTEDYGFCDRGVLVGEAKTLGQPNSFLYCSLYFFMTAVFFNASNSVSALKLRP